jgi:Endomembrane protein 70
MDMHEDVQEDSGWKLVHGDVFRPPKHTLLLSVLLGSGSQLFMMVGATTSITHRLVQAYDSFCVIGISFTE